MAEEKFSLRARRPASLVAFNNALPSNFKLIRKVKGKWWDHVGVDLSQIDNLTLKTTIRDGDGIVVTPAVLSTAVHYNLIVIGGPEVGEHAWSGWAGIMIDSGDPDFGDARLNKSKVKQWFKNNGVERLDTAAEHPRSGRADMRWFRWTDGTEWLDITIDEPQQRRRVWL